jgi:tetratricopeptide (TPR) repeat protein
MKRILFLAPVLAAALLVGACGGDDKPPAKYPTAGSDGGTTDNGGGGTTDNGTPTDAPIEHADLSEDAKSSYEKGYKAWSSGDLEGAKAAFKDATNKDPKSAPAFFALGCVVERLGDNLGAQSAYKSALAAKADFEPAMGAYAINLARIGRGSDADAFLVQQKNKYPQSARILTYLAEVKSLAKDSAGAQQSAGEALKIDPNLKEAMVVIARDHYRSGRMELAKYALKAILEGFGMGTPARDPENPEAHLLRGLIYRAAGDRGPAMKDFEAARQKRPDMVEALIQLGAMRLEAGNAQESQSVLELAIKFAPQSALAHMNLGDCYRLLTRYTDAKKELDTALSLDSTLAAAHYDLGLMYLFAQSYPGMSAMDQVGAALRELNTYKTMRGPKPVPGVNDDIDELISFGTQKQKDLQMAAGGGAAPAAGPKDAGKG